MIDYIVVNPSNYREDCFNLDGCSNSRWQVDFYQPNPDYDPTDKYDEKHYVGTLHFTAYDLTENTPEKAYQFFIAGMNILYNSFLLDQTLYNNPSDPFPCFTYEEVLEEALQGMFHFYEKMFNKQLIFTRCNIVEFKQVAYLYYSSLKLLSYGFNNTNTPCFECLEDFHNLINGFVTLKEGDPHSVW